MPDASELLKQAVLLGTGIHPRLDGDGLSQEDRQDGWSNEVAGIGTDRDKQQHWKFDGVPVHEDEKFASLFAKDSLIRKGMAAIPETALSKGWELTLDPEYKDRTKEVKDLLKGLKAESKLVEGWTMGRTFGGCAVILGVDDKSDPSKPLNLEKIKSLNFLNVLDRRYLQVSKIYNDPLGPNWGEPEAYKIQSIQHLSAPDNAINGKNTTDALGQEVHASRVLIFEGAPTTLDMRQQLQLWWQSEIDLIYDDVLDFQSNWKAIGHLISESSIGIYEYRGLIAAMASGGGKKAILARMEMIDRAKSVARSILIDKEEEGFSKISETFTGVPDLIDRLAQRVSGSLGIPITLLFGRSPAGQNATGESDFRMFYDLVEKQRELKLQPKLELLVHIALIVLGIDPEKAKPVVFFKPLWELTALEKADLELKTAQKDQIYIVTAVASPEEIALTRWDEEGNFSPLTKLEQELRKDLLLAEQEAIEAQLEAGETIEASPLPAEKEPPKEPGAGEASPNGDSIEPEETEETEDNDNGAPVNK